MFECPQCGGGAERDPEHQRVIRCLRCWEAWVVPYEPRCPGAGRGSLSPALRLLEDYRHLNR
ncbi:hypothetical protein ACQUSR_14200 [Streptomyces sp. P1-3]|uniref:hypothetical protein n=1 Tax=Streptomyces sp. P1-3 TaxID=3421658 RepID=UPI003D36DA2C